jgi:hypothetical protein
MSASDAIEPRARVRIELQYYISCGVRYEHPSGRASGEAILVFGPCDTEAEAQQFLDSLCKYIRSSRTETINVSRLLGSRDGSPSVHERTIKRLTLVQETLGKGVHAIAELSAEGISQHLRDAGARLIPADQAEFPRLPHHIGVRMVDHTVPRRVV